MCAAPASSYESDFNESGEPVELDHLLASDLPHHDESLEGIDGASGDFIEGALSADAFDDDHLIDFDDDSLDETSAQHKTAAPAKRGRPKSGEAAPAPVLAESNPDGSPITIYQRLNEYGLLRKVTDIVMATVRMPWNLRQDATQEVHATWAGLVAKPQFARNQVANYAFRSGQHAALKLRRGIGAVVTIPGALFRTGRNTSFMESIGAAVNPKDVDDYRDSIELSIEPEDMMQHAKVQEGFFEQRLAPLVLTNKQRLVAKKALVERLSIEEISAELDMDSMYVERLLNQVTKKLQEHDNGGPEKKVKPQSAKKVDGRTTRGARAMKKELEEA